MQTLKAQYQYSNHSNQVDFFTSILLEDYKRTMHFALVVVNTNITINVRIFLCVKILLALIA